MGSAIYLIIGVLTFIYLLFDFAVRWEKFEKGAGGAFLAWPTAALLLVVGTVFWPLTWLYVGLRFLQKLKASKEVTEADGEN